MRLTVLGTGTAQPEPDTPASGLLVQENGTCLLVDCGSGAVASLLKHIDPRQLTALVVGHLHGDHFLDIVPLRYLFPWGGTMTRPLPVFLPPGGKPHIDAIAGAISERQGFFDDAFDIDEYDPSTALPIGHLELCFSRSRHYVPAWSVSIRGSGGERLVYLGDTGPSDGAVEFARGADVLVLEATLRSVAEDDVNRGHLTPDEAIDLARRAGVGRALLVHYPSAEREKILAICAATGGTVAPATAGLVLEISGSGDGGNSMEARGEGAPTAAARETNRRRPTTRA